MADKVTVAFTERNPLTGETLTRQVEVVPGKAFQMRRAGHVPVDAAMDEAYLDTLAIIDQDPNDRRKALPPRALTAAERQAVMRGTLQPNGTMPEREARRR